MKQDRQYATDVQGFPLALNFSFWAASPYSPLGSYVEKVNNSPNPLVSVPKPETGCN